MNKPHLYGITHSPPLLPLAVIEGDYAVCMRHLMHFPTVYEVNYLIQRALHLRNPVREGLMRLYDVTLK